METNDRCVNGKCNCLFNPLNPRKYDFLIESLKRDNSCPDISIATLSQIAHVFGKVNAENRLNWIEEIVHQERKQLFYEIRKIYGQATLDKIKDIILSSPINYENTCGAKS
jgi:hypothetical protein